MRQKCYFLFPQWHQATSNLQIKRTNLRTVVVEFSCSTHKPSYLCDYFRTRVWSFHSRFSEKSYPKTPVLFWTLSPSFPVHNSPLLVYHVAFKGLFAAGLELTITTVSAPPTFHSYSQSHSEQEALLFSVTPYLSIRFTAAVHCAAILLPTKQKTTNTKHLSAQKSRVLRRVSPPKYRKRGQPYPLLTLIALFD